MRALSLSLWGGVRGLVSRALSSSMVSGFVIVATLTMVSKVVSFLKDATVARSFGTGDELDAFMLSFGFVSFVATLLGGGLPQAFLPLYAEADHHRGPRRADRLAVQSTVGYAFILGAFALVIHLAAPTLVDWAAQGFHGAKRAIAVQVLRELWLFMVCFGMSYQLAAWLRANNCFAVPAAAPMLVPLAIIACLFWEHPNAGVGTLVRGTVLGGLLHLGALVLALLGRFHLHGGKWLRSTLRLWEPRVRTVLANSMSFLVAGIIFSSAPVVDQTMAAWLAPGSVAVLSYTDKICGIILAVTVSPATEVLFPAFAQKVARQDWSGLKRQLLVSAGSILALALPMVIALCWLAPFVVRLLFERGAFDADDTQRVATVLRYAVLQIPFYVVGGLAARVVVALQATRFVMALSLVGLVANIVLNLIFMKHLGAAGIALSTVIVHLISAFFGCLYVVTEMRRRMAATDPQGV